MKTVSGIVLVFAASIVPLCAADVQSPDRKPAPKESATTASHGRAVAALKAEEQKLDAGKSTLFNVCQVAKNLRTVDLQISTNSTQRIAAHQRHVALIKRLKDQTDKRIETGTLAPLEGKLIAEELKRAEAELVHAKGGTN